MERLTQWFDNGTCRVVGLAAEHEEKHATGELIDLLLDRLAVYEDTGMEPDEINALREFCESHTRTTMAHIYELVQAEKEGRLVLVPRPGDVLYETDPAHGVVKHTVTDVYWGANTSAVDDNGQTWADYYTNEDIETAHTTREAAEAVMAAGSIMEGFPCE